MNYKSVTSEMWQEVQRVTALYTEAVKELARCEVRLLDLTNNNPNELRKIVNAASLFKIQETNVSYHKENLEGCIESYALDEVIKATP